MPSKIDFYYTELKEDFDLDHQIVCVNMEQNANFVKKYKELIKKLCD